jgi:hypothetical protein
MTNLTSISDTYLDLSHYGMHRSIQRRPCFPVDPELVDTVIRPQEDFREMIVPHSAGFSRNVSIIENLRFDRSFEFLLRS